MNNIYIVIPAREKSTRLPNKLLLDKTGKPLIQHTYEAVCDIPGTRTTVVTDSCLIHKAIVGIGGRAVMSGTFSCGTDRIADFAATNTVVNDWIINVQADEPEISPFDIERLIHAIKHHDLMMPDDHVVFTLGHQIGFDEASNHNVVKIALDIHKRALYFSRSLIPWLTTDFKRGDKNWWRHVGIYAYRVLTLLIRWPKSMSVLEQFESLEQLRWYETNVPIRVVTATDTVHRGIDIQEDYDSFCARQGKHKSASR